ncbi:pleckstrin-2-like [Glandiceps talaboti]
MDDGQASIVNFKEGFLVKKGHRRTNWRTRWFVLAQESLSYYKKRDDSLAVGVIALQGCSVISPCPEYNKKPGVFRILTRGKKEFLIQAASVEERDDWVQLIGEAIRRAESSKSQGGNGASKDTLPNISHGELIGAMQDASAGLPRRNVVVVGKEYKNCFRGTDVTEWLVSWSFVPNKEDATLLANSLLQEGHIQSLTNGKSGESSEFENNDENVYRFSTLRLSEVAKSPFDSSDEDSDDEGTGNGRVLDALAREPKGNILKQGFLMKRGHVRHTWKTRMFVLKKDPPHMLYYKGSKQDEKPLGVISLDRSRVELVISGKEDSEVKNKSRTNLFKIITHKGDNYIMQANTEDELDGWVKAIQSPHTYFTE